MRRLEHKHPRPIRWMHWFNVVLLSGMIWSGLLIYWANDVYSVRSTTSDSIAPARSIRSRCWPTR